MCDFFSQCTGYVYEQQIDTVIVSSRCVYKHFPLQFSIKRKIVIHAVYASGKHINELGQIVVSILCELIFSINERKKRTILHMSVGNLISTIQYRNVRFYDVRATFSKRSCTTSPQTHARSYGGTMRGFFLNGQGLWSQLRACSDPIIILFEILQK